jgi:alpha-amylase
MGVFGMRENIIYYIMIDRFANGRNGKPTGNDPMDFQGGNIRGIIEKLDYLKDLGITAIMVTPPIVNRPKGYHGYWAEDFYDIDPHFGSMGDFKELVEKAHKKGMEIILDIILNHTGFEHPWLKDERKKNWFHPYRAIQNWWDQEEVEKGWLGDLPDLNHENPETRKYLMDMALWWIRETGVDGFRLDAARHVPGDFWVELIDRIKKIVPDSYLIGEVWDSNPEYLDTYYRMGIDGLFNYSLYGPIVDCFGHSCSMQHLKWHLGKDLEHPNRPLNGIFVDNHDNPRFVTIAKNYGEKRLKMALTFLMTYPAIPIIYYGTEVGMEGGFDPDCRRFMEWDKVPSSSILPYLRQLTRFRTENALHHGELNILYTDDHVMIYERTVGEKRFVVAFNNDLIGKTIKLSLDSHEELTAVFDTRHPVYRGQGEFAISIQGLGTSVFELKDKSKAQAA